jgi:hypothetical protein
MSRDVSALIKQGPKPAASAVPADEFTHRQYLADVARLRDFTPEEDKMMWAKPIGPRWRN